MTSSISSLLDGAFRYECFSESALRVTPTNNYFIDLSGTRYQNIDNLSQNRKIETLSTRQDRLVSWNNPQFSSAKALLGSNWCQQAPLTRYSDSCQLPTLRGLIHEFAMIVRGAINPRGDDSDNKWDTRTLDGMPRKLYK